MRTFLAVVVLLALPSLGAAQQVPSREALITMLSGFEDTPTLAQMQALGDGTIPMLAALYDDPQVIQPVRLRAVEAMGAFHTAEARTFLLRVIGEPGQSPIVIREAIEALGQSQGAAAIPQIGAQLSSPERGIREAAIEALASIDTAAARQRLSQHLPSEHDTDLRARIAALTAAH